MSTSKKVNTPPELVNFYLSPIEGNPKRFWWQTMERGRMAQIFQPILDTPGVMLNQKADVEKVLKTLKKQKK